MTQSVLATAAGVSRSTIRAIERGHYPRFAVAMSLAEVLQSSPQELGLEKVPAAHVAMLKALPSDDLLRYVKGIAHTNGADRHDHLAENEFQYKLDEHDWTVAEANM